MERPATTRQATARQATRQTIGDVMTANPRTFSTDATIREAAEEMRLSSIGAVVVEEDGEICGILTDRDIVVRCIAAGGDPGQDTIGPICSREITTLTPNDDVDRAIAVMREKGIRRIPVVENGKPVGMVSLGDLALERDPRSALGGISAAAPNQ